MLFPQDLDFLSTSSFRILNLEKKEFQHLFLKSKYTLYKRLGQRMKDKIIGKWVKYKKLSKRYWTKVTDKRL